MREWCDTNEILKKIYRRVVIILHPFELIQTTVTTPFITNCPQLKVTNAFLKMWETLKYLIEETHALTIGHTLRMYDIAGAPGMFVIATDNYLRKHFPKTTFDWYTSSLEADYALVDEYKLFESNPKRYQPCDVTNPTDIKNCLSHGKFQLVTGDIGIPHTYESRELQEENQADIEWGQMVMGLNLVEENGIVFLKMYTMLTYEAIYLLDVLSMYFKHVHVVKPYTSRITNFESYLLCIGRNDKSCDKVPLTRPRVVIPFESPNIKIMKRFESKRLDDKYEMLNVVLKMLEKDMSIRFKEAKENSRYLQYFNEFRSLYNELCHINSEQRTNGGSEKGNENDSEKGSENDSERQRGQRNERTISKGGKIVIEEMSSSEYDEEESYDESDENESNNDNTDNDDDVSDDEYSDEYDTVDNDVNDNDDITFTLDDDTY